MLLGDVNFVAVMLCVPVWLALSALWYSPAVMDMPIVRQWTGGGSAMQRFGRAQWGLVPIAFVSGLAVSIILSWYTAYGGVANWMSGAGIGALVWACFVVPVKAADLIYRPVRVEMLFFEMVSLLSIFLALGSLLGWWAART